MVNPSRQTPDALKLIVTNLSYEVKYDDLRVLFLRFGNCRINLKMYFVCSSLAKKSHNPPLPL